MRASCGLVAGVRDKLAMDGQRAIQGSEENKKIAQIMRDLPVTAPE